jgi:membrane-bound lytic murein transglycosylase D
LCYKSTKAAAKYLNDLYKEFGDWLLVIAAYNSGPGPVYTAIKKSGSHNFWRLQQYLPLETRLHVKRFIGTHYYFEGEGSITTLTKAEATEHLKAVTKFMENANELKEVASVAAVENNKAEPVMLVQ